MVHASDLLQTEHQMVHNRHLDKVPWLDVVGLHKGTPSIAKSDALVVPECSNSTGFIIVPPQGKAHTR